MMIINKLIKRRFKSFLITLIIYTMRKKKKKLIIEIRNEY